VLGAKLIEAASEEKNLERFVHVSTSDVYDIPNCDAMKPSFVDVNLPYNSTKIGRRERSLAAKESGLPVTVVRQSQFTAPQ